MDLPSVYGSNEPLRACGIMPVFFSVSKQVALVVIPVLSVRQHPDKTVKIISIFFYYYTARYYHFFFSCFFFHPCDCFPIHFFSQLFWFHTKPCAEHFGQNNYICRFLYVVDLTAKHFQVGCFIFP